ncbi:hypothetical protein L9F63_026373, partial [Diploptera punctata]
NRTVRFLVLLACTVVVPFPGTPQLSECFYKLSQPPVSSFTRIIVNKSVTYPAVTICRYPSYKSNVLKRYNLNSVKNHPDYDNFPFQNVTLEKLWQQATYREDEKPLEYRFTDLTQSLHLENALNIDVGCHTVLPLIQTTASGIYNGFTIMLNEIGDTGDLTETPKTDPEIGWYIFLHSATEPWIESTEGYEGTDESIFLKEQEEVHVKIGVQEYFEVNKGNDICNTTYHYSSVACEHLCKTKKLVNRIGCTAPWLTDIGAPLCNTSIQVQSILSGYLYNNSSYDDLSCNCMRSCHSLQYTPYITRRYEMQSNGGTKLSHLYLYYTSRRIEVSEERLAYDWSLFLADLGGSLGFLLGLSVLGIIGIVERLIDMLYGNLQPPWRKHSIMSKQSKDSSLQFSKTSSETSQRRRLCGE